jgi:hypothetical protein
MEMAMATTWAMAMGDNVAGNEEGNGKGSKSNHGNGNEDGRQQRGQW